MSSSGERPGEKLRQARVRLKWTQERLAVALGMPPSAGQLKIHRWESGQTSVSVEDLERAAVAMGLPPYALQADEEIDRALRWIEWAARTEPAPPTRLDPLLTAVSRLRDLGPLPAQDDEAGWAAYLERLREQAARPLEE